MARSKKGKAHKKETAVRAVQKAVISIRLLLRAV